MPEITPHYLADNIISNLKIIFDSSDFPFVKISRFFHDIQSIEYNPNLEVDEQIGYFKRKKGPAVLETFWQSKEFIEFLSSVTDLDWHFSSAYHMSYSPGDYSLLHIDELEPKRLNVVYDFTKKWRIEWGGTDLYAFSDRDALTYHRDYGSLRIAMLEKGDLSCTRYVSLKSKEEAAIDFVTYFLD